jgi:colanic acid/amylovoran biosynthesis protein
VGDDEISAILDASGFAFGDRLGAERTLRFAEDVEVACQAGKQIVMLPQALGPFEVTEIRDAFARIVNACDRVYARDPVSLEHAHAAAGNDERIRLAPDFTNLIECPPAGQRAKGGGRACIVPNQRMIEHASDSKAAGLYLPMLNQCIAATRQAGLEPFILIHGKHDVPLAEALQKDSRQLLEIVQESDPVRIKHVIGSSGLVIASRFHALVSALSQGVPAIGTSWSHKYEMLFSDYECDRFLLPVGVNEDQIFELVGLATDSGRDELVNKLRSNGQRMVEQTRRMWEDVASIVFLKT